VATCGGRSVCLIDTSSGSVIAKYTHLEEEEEFLCLAWGIVPDVDDTFYRILAVGGIFFFVVFFHF